MLSSFIDILELFILADVILSWVIPDERNNIRQFIGNITKPLYIPGRKLQERFATNVPVDISPVIAMLILFFIRGIIRI
ncbi:YggT family protein [Clostridium oryzae]|uniref:YggT family protein n=1 Tax=Clostridium oryzae TaxID=1450648 RepID=UPI00241D145C|nr:YggT family protein [Clostridium oryzae]